MDELDRADVEAAGGLCGDQHLRVAVDLAGEDHLLLVSAGERARLRLRAASADVELRDQASRPFDETIREEPAETRRRRLAVVVECDVLGEREVEHEAASLPVLRDVPEPGVEVVPCAVARHILAGELDGSGSPAAEAPRSRR